MIPRVDNLSGWQIGGPYSTGRKWIARRWGVQISSNTYEGLVSMIQQRSADERAAKVARRPEEKLLHSLFGRQP